MMSELTSEAHKWDDTSQRLKFHFENNPGIVSVPHFIPPAQQDSLTSP